MPRTLLTHLKRLYHFLIGYWAALWAGLPSESMIVIGITGTKGKTSTVYSLYQVLTKLGLKVGMSSSVYLSNAQEVYKSSVRNSMPGNGKIHSLMRQAKRNGATVFIVEVTSEGLAQDRHRGLHFDCVALTNLYPEHLEAHKGFENYKQAKGLLFRSFERSRPKIIQGKIIQPVAWVNQDDPYHPYYQGLTHKSVQSIGQSAKSTLQMESIKATESGLAFQYQDTVSQTSHSVTVPILGEFMAYNLLFVIGIAHWLGYGYEEIHSALATIQDIPGRMNKVASQPTIFVDYAHIPEALQKVYSTVNTDFRHNGKTIAVLGACGGGRDTWKRGPMGKIAGQMNDYVIVTNEDPYDEDPQQIIDQVFAGVIEAGKLEGQNTWRIISRKEAIIKALALAQKSDVIIITGKGSETSIMGPKGSQMPWNDTEEVLKLLK